MNRKTILLVEDADTLREVLVQILEEDGFDVVAVESVKKAREQFRHSRFDCVLSDFKLPDENGIDLLRTIREIDRDTPFLIMTAYGTIEIAIEAMQLGANDFILKPFHPESLQEKLHQVIAHRQIVSRASGSRPKSQKRFATHNQRTQDVLTQAEKAARVDTTVLLLGESGTGKELIARAVHNWSPRSEKPFIAINCDAMPAELLESEFFGHEAGAFTGATQTRVGVLELASEGTLFLDEVGEMPPQLQVKLLRALQEREIKRVGGNKTIRINPRIVAATNVNIEDALREGRLREDFYYRLAVISLQIPPLRERPEDILPLVDYCREFFTNRAGRDTIQLSEDAATLLRSYPWPGNVRELENVMER
ncbi:MAG: sigma-54-dependent transcriptional regulator, partial [Bdellovibrionota bacterium]